MEILRLKRRADWSALLAKWHGDEWGHLYTTWNAAVALREFLEEPLSGLPVTLVAAEADRVLGSVSLVYRDLPDASEQWDPWMASLYVDPAARGKGVGGKLVAAAISTASSEGVPILYCLTENRQRLFHGHGFETIGEQDLNGCPVTVLQRVL